jgi:hypothetical protein
MLYMVAYVFDAQICNGTLPFIAAGVQLYFHVHTQQLGGFAWLLILVDIQVPAAVLY